MRHKKLHTVCSLAVAVALVFSLVLPASAVGELGDVELPEPGEDGYITVTTPEQLARVLSDTDAPEKLSKIRLGNDISTADSEITKIAFFIDRDLTLDLGGYTWTAKEPVDGSPILGIVNSVEGESENVPEVTICNGTIQTPSGSCGIIRQEVGYLSLVDIKMNGGVYTASTINKIENCTITQSGNTSALKIGDSSVNATGFVDHIYNSTIKSDWVAIFLADGTISAISNCSQIQGGSVANGCGIWLGDEYDDAGNPLQNNAKINEILNSNISGGIGIRNNSGSIGTVNCSSVSGGILNEGNGTIRRVMLDNDAYNIDGIYGGTITEGILTGGTIGELCDCTVTNTADYNEEAVNNGVAVFAADGGNIGLISNCDISGDSAGIRVTGSVGVIEECPHVSGGIWVLSEGSIDSIQNCTNVDGGVWVRDSAINEISNSKISFSYDNGNGMGVINLGMDNGEDTSVQAGSIGAIRNCTLTGAGTNIRGIALWAGKIDEISSSAITSADGMDSIWNEGVIGTISDNQFYSGTDYAVGNYGTIRRLEDNTFSYSAADVSTSDVYNNAAGIIETVSATGELDGNLFTADSGWTLLNEGTVNNWDILDESNPSEDDKPGGSTGGSSSSHPSNTTTEKNPDGSTTTTVKSSNGTITETTKYPDGSKTVIKTEPDGTVTTTQEDVNGNIRETIVAPDETVTTVIDNADGSSSETITTADGQVESEVTISDERIKAFEGDVLPLPLPDATAPEGRTSEILLTVDLPENTAVTVEVPLESVSMNTVAVLNREDGSEEIILNAVPGEYGLQIPLDGSATLRIVDNSKEFSDVEDGSWYSDPVAFITSRELFMGTGGEGAFSPEQPMNRAMLVTVLHQMAGEPGGAVSSFDDVETGAWYSTAVNWASETGIVMGDGTSFHPDQVLTREALAVMLYRYASPDSVTDTAGLVTYADYEAVNPWAIDAMSWAVENGIISGKEDNVLDPQGSASRAEVATMLMRFIQATTTK